MALFQKVGVYVLLLEKVVATQLYFKNVKDNHDILDQVPFYEKKIDRITECHHQCLQRTCQYVKIVENGSAFICSLYGFVEDLANFLVPSPHAIQIFKIESSFQDCQGWMNRDYKQNGIYTILDPQSRRKRVYCDMTTDGGGWMAFQKRFDGSVDFNQNWEAYKNGFGGEDGEYWLGNEFIHQYTTKNKVLMRAEGTTYSGERHFVKMEGFAIGNETSGYRVVLGDHISGANWLNWKHFSGMKFSTKDVDNDETSSHCAADQRSGWWFKGCSRVNFNGIRTGAEDCEANEGIRWRGVFGLGTTKSLSASIMMFKKSDQ